MKKKWMSMVLAFAMMAGLLSGCGGAPSGNEGAKQEETPSSGNETSGESGDTSTAATEEITVWSFLSQEEMDNYVEDFNAVNPDIKVNVVVFPSDTYMTKLNATLRAGAGAPDVFFTEVKMYGEIKETNFAENLSQEPYNADAIMEDMVPYVAELDRDSAGNVKGMSWQACPGGFWYNKALAREYLGTDDPDELEIMLGNWDSIAEAAAEVYEKSNGQVFLLDAYNSISCVVLGTRTEEYVVDGKLTCLDLFEEALKIGVSIRQNNGDSGTEAWDPAWAAGFYENQNFIITGLPSWGLHYAIKANTPQEADDTDDTWGFCQAPSSYNDGGTWISVYSGSEKKEAAWEFLRTLTADEEYLMRYVERNGDMIAHIPTIEKVIESGFRDPFTGDQDIYQYMYEAAMSISPKDVTKYDMAIVNSFNDKLKLAMAGSMTVEEAMEAFKSDIATQFPEITIE